jgi:hypothetical protein
MNTRVPTPIFRIVPVVNLPTIIERGGVHAPNRTPNDGRIYRVIHNVSIQEERRVRSIPCGPRGVVHDYVAFYFGPRSPMLLQLHTGQVPGHTEGQDRIIYLVSSAQAVQQNSTLFVFSDGHGIARFTEWFDNLQDLPRVDWQAVYARQWNDTLEDMDRQRRKQAKFLVLGFCPWDLIERVAVRTPAMRDEVNRILAAAPAVCMRPVDVKPDWYY